MPFTSALLPSTLVQLRDGAPLRTTIKAWGWGHFAKVERVEADPELFPDVSLVAPLAVFAIDAFQMRFPPSRSLPPTLLASTQ